MKMGVAQKYPIGQTLQKEFDGYGVFEGKVTEYNDKFGLYTIQYEDGDVEDMDEGEMDRYIAGEGSKPGEDEEEDYEDDNNYDDDDDEGEGKAPSNKGGKFFTQEEKEYALDLADKFKKKGSKCVDHTTYMPALAKALGQTEDYARRLYASAKTYVWSLEKRGKKRTSSSKPVNIPKKRVKPSVEFKGTLSYNEPCRVHYIRGWIQNNNSKTPEKFELVRNLDRPEEDPKDLPMDGTFHTANFDQEVHIKFTSKVDNQEYKVRGEGSGEDEGTFEILGTAILNTAAGGDPVFDIVLTKEYLTAPVKKKAMETPKDETPKKDSPKENELTKELLGIVRKIKQQKKFAWPFLEPVDINEVPDYLDVIKEPVDLSTMEKQIQKGDHYTTKEMLHADLKKMAANCKHYNRDDPESPYLECADALEKFLGTLFVES